MLLVVQYQKLAIINLYDVQGFIRSVNGLLTADSNKRPYQTDHSSLTQTLSFDFQAHTP